MKTGERAGFRAGFADAFSKNRTIFAVKKQKHHAERLKNRQNFRKSYRHNFDRMQARVYYSVARPVTIALFSFGVGLFAGTVAAPTFFTNAETAPVSIDTPAATTAEIASFSEKSAPARAEVTTIYNKSTAETPATAVATKAPATPEPTLSAGLLSIPKIGLSQPVSQSILSARELSVPATGISAYGNLLLGHAATAFASLKNLGAGDLIGYNGQKYVVANAVTLPVSSDRLYVGAYTTDDLALRQGSNLVLMTCTGIYRQFDDGTYTYSHRLLVFARPA